MFDSTVLDARWEVRNKKGTEEVKEPWLLFRLSVRDVKPRIRNHPIDLQRGAGADGQQQGRSGDLRLRQARLA